MTQTAIPEPGLFLCRVMHARLKPVRRRFVYRVFSILVDPDDPGSIAQGRVPFFSVDRFNVLGFRTRDFGYRNARPIRTWVEDVMSQAGLRAAPAAIRLLCLPRLWGYAFNPIAVFFVYGEDSRLSATIYQVSNTFGETHAYVAPVRPGRDPDAPLRQTADKVFYVSPFVGMAARYEFAIREPRESLSIGIKETGPEGHFLTATYSGQRRPFTAAEALKAVLGHPLMTLKVIAGIHWEAVRLWAKGARYHARPTPPDIAASAGRIADRETAAVPFSNAEGGPSRLAA